MTTPSNQYAARDTRWARVQALWERVGESLFYIPSLFMLTAVVVSQILVALDQSLGVDDLPAVFDSTVDSSRVLLSVIAGGTITAASVVFSLTLVAVQLASTQFSPRTLGSFLGDRAQQIIIGLVLGTFVYSLLVLRVIRAETEVGGDPFIPRFSVMVAVVLGVVAMIAVIASINRTAQGLRVEAVAGRITAETIAAIKHQFGDDSDAISPPQSVLASVTTPAEAPPESFEAETKRAGWIQNISVRRLLEAVPEGSHVLIHQSVGNYVLRGQVLVSVWPAPEEPDRMAERVMEGFVISGQRSRGVDVAFGITQLVDIAARALSPGVNDPKTAEEIVLRLGEVLVELSVRDLPPEEAEIEGCNVIRAAEPSHRDYVELAVEPIRRFGRTDPQVLSAIVRTLATAKEVAERRRPDAAVEAFTEQRELILTELDAITAKSDRALVDRTAAATDEE